MKVKDFFRTIFYLVNFFVFFYSWMINPFLININDSSENAAFISQKLNLFDGFVGAETEAAQSLNPFVEISSHWSLSMQIEVIKFQCSWVIMMWSEVKISSHSHPSHMYDVA